jgi:pyruvate dehydrogenase E1 component beta subunit
MTEMTLVKAVNHTLELAMSKNDKIIIIGEDVGRDGGVFRATEGLVDKFGEARVIDSPIAEAGIVGAAIGMSINGLRPVVEIQFSGFIYPAWQEIVSHVSRMRNRTRGRFTCPMVIRTPNGGGINALEHHSESMEAMYAHIPGLITVTPSSPKEAKGLLLAALESPDPVLFLEPIKIYRAFKEDVPEEYYTIPLGKARVVQEGTDVTIISWGAMVHTVIEAVREASRKGVSCEIIDLRTIMPWDVETVIASVQKTGRCVIVHEATKTAGFAAEIIATINEKALLSLEAPVVRVTGYDIVFPYYRNEKRQLPSVDRVIDAINRTARF